MAGNRRVSGGAAGVVGVTGNQWSSPKLHFTHTDFNAAALTTDIQLMALAPGQHIHAVKLIHSAAFAGGGALNYKLSIGLAADLEKFLPLCAVNGVPGSTVIYVGGPFVYCFDQGAPTSIRIQASCTGANLDQALTGAVDIWVNTSLAS